MKILFVCNLGKNRSRTAEELFKGEHETQSAGLYMRELTAKQLEWADTVMVMEDAQRSEIGKRFPKLYMQKRILCFDVPDTYYYNQPELVTILKEKFGEAMHDDNKPST